MKVIKPKHAVDVKAPILSQPQFCLAAGVDMATANNWIARRFLSRPKLAGVK